MRKKTDLDSAKKVALQLLERPIEKTESWPMRARHPFTSVGYIAIPKGDSFEGGVLEEGEPAFDMWKTRCKKFIEEAESMDQLFSLIEKPWRLTFLKLLELSLSKEAFTTLFVDAFRSMEAPNNDPNCSIADLVKYFKMCDPALLMDEEERKEYDAFPDEVTVYRGVTHYNDKKLKVLSWTISPSVAEWFARRFGPSEKGKVYTATIEKEHILAYFTNQSDHAEHEVVFENIKSLQ